MHNEGLAFVDCETTGLDPAMDEIWELAIVTGGNEVVIRREIDIESADHNALEINRYWQRQNEPIPVMSDHLFALRVGALLDGKHIVGVNPAFDSAFIRELLADQDVACGWNHHLVDVLALVAGQRRLNPPWSSSELSLAVGINPNDYDRHTALGDAMWAKAIYEAVMA